MFRFRHVLITGASDGIGAALARYYADHDIRLTLFGRAPERLLAVAATCRALGADVEPVFVDLRDAVTLRAAMLAADRAHPVDLLVANAGIGGTATVAGEFGEAADAACEVAAVNFGGTVATVSALAPVFAQRGRGAIAIVSSLAALAPVPVAPTYAASKAGLAAYARNIRLALRPKGVHVALVCPGFVDTAMSRDLPGPKPGLMSADEAADLIGRGLAAGRTSIAFPRSLHAMTILASLAPDRLVAAVMARWSERRP